MRIADAIPRLDVEWFRSVDDLMIVERAPTTSLIVLGSSQPAGLLATSAAQGVRRRGGGGAVAVDPDATIWIDLWVPHTDDMVDLDVVGGLRAIGELWHSALTRLGANEIDIVDAPRPEGGEVACFGGLGHGEIVGPTGAKVVGITAWRSRQGSLFQCASYLTPCTDFLVDALDLSEVDRRWLRAHLTRSTELLGAVIPSIETSGGATAARAQMSGALRDAWVATGAGVPVTEVVLPVKLAGERASADRIDEVE